MNQALITIALSVFGLGAIGLVGYLLGRFRNENQQGAQDQQLRDISANNQVLRAEAEAAASAPKTPEELQDILTKGDI